MQISDEAVEAAAAGMWHHRPMQRTADGAPVPFSEVKSYQRFRYLDQAHAALEAAAPHILAGAADAAEADELTTAAEVIYDLRRPASRLKCEPVPTMRGDQVIPDEAAATAARAHQELMAKAGYPSWEALMPSGREIQMNRMRAALEAAAPYMLMEAWRAGAIATADYELEYRVAFDYGDELPEPPANPYGSE